MRVISGKAKGRRLKRVPGDTTRPIMDRVKESLFNILGPAVEGATWLDLFAGTGQVGIEALSRGAAKVVFVDKSRQAIRTVQWNLEHTGLLERAEILQRDAFTYLERHTVELFDLIYVAPPQYQELWIETLALLDRHPASHLVAGGLVVAQIDPKEYRQIDLGRLEFHESRRYGNTMLCFYRFATGASNYRLSSVT